MANNHKAHAGECVISEMDAAWTVLDKSIFELKEDMSTREKLLYSAAHVFSGKDFYSTKLEDIAEYAHLAKGTIYLYFKDKTDLIVSAIEFFDDLFLNAIKNKLMGVNSPMMRFKIALHLWLAIYSHCMSGARGINSLLSNLPDEYLERFRTMRKNHVNFIKDLLNAIAERVGRGSLKRSTELLAEVIIDSMLGYSSRVDAAEFSNEYPPEKYARFLVDVVLPQHEWMQEKVQ